MGEIIGSRAIGGKIILRVKLEESESLLLRGNMKNIRLFCLDECDTKSRIIEKGKNGVTKHFLIPTVHKHKFKKKPHSIAYQVSDLGEKMIFIYLLDQC